MRAGHVDDGRNRTAIDPDFYLRDASASYPYGGGPFARQMHDAFYRHDVMLKLGDGEIRLRRLEPPRLCWLGADCGSEIDAGGVGADVRPKRPDGVLRLFPAFAPRHDEIDDIGQLFVAIHAAEARHCRAGNALGDAFQYCFACRSMNPLAVNQTEPGSAPQIGAVAGDAGLPVKRLAAMDRFERRGSGLLVRRRRGDAGRGRDGGRGFGGIRPSARENEYQRDGDNDDGDDGSKRCRRARGQRR